MSDSYEARARRGGCRRSDHNQLLGRPSSGTARGSRRIERKNSFDSRKRHRFREPPSPANTPARDAEMMLEELTDGVSFAELLETRAIVEPELAARAAVRKTEANLSRLESALRGLNFGLAAGSLKLAVDCERVFHENLWDAAGDRVICRMLATVHMVMGKLVETSWLLADYKLAVRQHGNILVAVRSGNPGAASHAMTVHLDTTATILSRVLRVRSNSRKTAAR